MTQATQAPSRTRDILGQVDRDSVNTLLKERFLRLSEKSKKYSTVDKSILDLRFTV